MTIDMHAERLLTMSEAAKSLPTRPNLSTVWRWAMRGVRGERLETVVIGGQRYTSEEALQRFSERLTAAANGEPPPPQPTPRRQRQARQRRVDAALRELERDGV